MNLFRITLGIILTLFSTAILSYISMATMIGPWIAPTLVLITGLAFKLRLKTVSSDEKNQELALIQAIGSIGGIVATAVGFTLPTLYFLDRPAFEELLAHPLSFCFLVGATILAAGSFGILLGKAFNRKFLVKENLEFPVSHLIHKTITSQTQGKQAKQMIAGFSVTGLICALRDLLPLPKNIFLVQSLLGPRFPIMIMPMLWAIGFIAGTAIALPLLVGMLSKYLILYPLNNHAAYLPFTLFPILDKKLFAMAFCSGLILAQVLPSLLKYPALILKGIKQYTNFSYFSRLRARKNSIKRPPLETLLALILPVALLIYLRFPPFSIFIIIPLTIISTYHISFIGGKIGLVQIGRFTTFVMIPTMLLFNITPLQLTFLCVFVSTCMTTTSDLLFDYKVAQLCDISFTKIRRCQWFGLVITATSLGFILWLLFTNLQLGTSELFAQRGKARALLVQSFSFNWTVLSLGFVYGLILKKLKINPTMVFGGILMPNGLTIGLVLGAMGTFLTKDKTDYFPFFSGVFASESIWLIASILLKMF